MNSDTYDRGMGIGMKMHASAVMEAHHMLGRPRFYSRDGLGVNANNAESTIVKFHPGMENGCPRVEGYGGFKNQNMGWTPANYTDSGQQYHQFAIKLTPNGTNTLSITGTMPGQHWEKSWVNQILTGNDLLPSLFLWCDHGAYSPAPQIITKVTYTIELEPMVNDEDWLMIEDGAQ